MMTKREQLEKNVVDTAAAFAAAAADDEAAYAVYTAYAKAKLALAEYLKEQDDAK